MDKNRVLQTRVQIRCGRKKPRENQVYKSQVPQRGEEERRRRKNPTDREEKYSRTKPVEQRRNPTKQRRGNSEHHKPT